MSTQENPEKNWLLTLSEMVEIPVIDHPHSERYAEITPFNKTFRNLISGQHMIRFVGSILNTSNNPPHPPPPIDLEILLGGNIVQVGGQNRTHITLESGNYYHFDFTIPFDVSSINPGALLYKMYTTDIRITKLTCNAEFMAQFME